MEEAFYEINCILTKLWVLMSKKDKINEISPKNDIKICAHTLKNCFHTLGTGS